MKKRPVFWLLSGMLAVAAIAGGSSFYRAVHVVPLTDKAFQFELLPEQTFKQLTDDLVQRGILDNPFYWTLHARIQSADRRLKAGTYRIEAGTTLNRLLAYLVEGKTLRYYFTIYEGWELRKIIDAMQQHPQIAMVAGTPEEIRTNLKIEYNSAEGWIYPDTYAFEKHTSNLKLFEKGYDLMKKKLNALWEARDKDAGLPFESPYQALILASIVEKETADSDEYRQIAGVFISRLKKGMRLQADPTVIYGLGGNFDGNLRKSDLITDTPYNTYVHNGLPPTPIAMPSEKSIAAVLQPEIQGYLYFVARGDGKHHFSKTYEEHREAVRRYQQKGQ